MFGWSRHSDGGAVERHLVDEGDERVADGVEGAVVIEVLGVDRGDHGDRRRELEERAVGLVGLGHQVLALPEPRVGAEARHAPADDDGRVEAALGEHGADHRRGRRLAVRAGDRDAVLEPHQLGQHLGARDHGDLRAARAACTSTLSRDTADE